jgi:hypothetical protein
MNITKKRLNKSDKFAVFMCENTFCNPTCKGTMFEDKDKVTSTPKLKFIRDKKTRKRYIKLIMKSKDQLFGKKNSILKDGFNEKIPHKIVNKMKRQGAISGCHYYIKKKDFPKVKKQVRKTVKKLLTQVR